MSIGTEKIKTDLDALRYLCRELGMPLPAGTTEVTLPRDMLAAIDDFQERMQPRKKPPVPDVDADGETVQFSGTLAEHTSTTLERSPRQYGLDRDAMLGDIAKLIAKLRPMGVVLPDKIKPESLVYVLVEAFRKILRAGDTLRPTQAKAPTDLAAAGSEPMQFSADDQRDITPQEADRIVDNVFGRKPA